MQRALRPTLLAVVLVLTSIGTVAAAGPDEPGIVGIHADEAAAHEGDRPQPAPTTAPRMPVPDPRSTSGKGVTATGPITGYPPGLVREVFGFLPYWELNDASTRLDLARLSTIAYFGVGAAADGTLQKKDAKGKATVGWAGWISDRMTNLIADAHAADVRVVLTVQSFAWTSTQQARQKKLLGSASARSRLATSIAAAVRDRGVDGVNLDVEPIVKGYDDEFTALIRSVRRELDRLGKGYQLTFDTTGRIGNYPIEKATGAGAADAIVIMGYDYRQASSSPVGSIAPLHRPGYDIADTVAAYTARVPASRLILGVPYYGRAWSTKTSAINAANTSGPKYGSSTSVTYDTAMGVLADEGRRYDLREAVAWTAYRRDSCSKKYGCVKTWRQLYVDDATALRAKYGLVNAAGLRGIGIWALGYDGNRPELWDAIADNFAVDVTPPRASIVGLPISTRREAFTVKWRSSDDVGVVGHDVDVSIDGGPWAAWLRGATAGAAEYAGARGHAFAFRVRARDAAGNATAWDGVPTYQSAPRLAAGGFGRVVVSALNGRAKADTSAKVVTKLKSGDRVQIRSGPVSADGKRWYRVRGPMTAWPDGGGKDMWVAASGGGKTYLRAGSAPSTTTIAVDAVRVGGPSLPWHPVDPVRLLDTRAGSGLSGTFASGVPRVVQLAGRGSLPVDAEGITATITATGATGSGYLAAGDRPTNRPTTSLVRVAKGQTTSGGVSLRLDDQGRLAIVYVGTKGSRVHLIVDVTGYYRAGGGPTWHPVDPVRLLDTRAGSGLSGTFASGVPRVVQLAGRGSLPVDAEGITATITATGATGSGYLAAGDRPTNRPTTSLVRVAKGQTTSGGVSLRLDDQGRLAIVYVGTKGSRVHLIVDVTGYYRAGGGPTWHPVDPVRLLDTRAGSGLSGTFASGVPRVVQLAGRGSLPVDAEGITATITATGATGSGYLAAGDRPTNRPTTSLVRVAKGQTTSGGVSLRLDDQGRLAIVYVGTKGSRVHLIVDVTGYYR